MPLLGTYRGQALPYYGRLIIADPSLSGAQEVDFQQCVTDSEDAIIGASRWRVALKAAQDSLQIVVNLELWNSTPNTEAGEDWEGRRELTLEFPGGRLCVENISDGPIPLSPGDIEAIDLPQGPGMYRITASHRGRDQAAAAAQELWDADELEEGSEAEYAKLAGPEQYLLRIWPA
ncbi:hypothetical protein AB0G04_20525 [Actinoplanes sp. NPDC023801]|uniref:hypothetical protein n=1 Tax=Actinoplanes sp. NPDC023801 TaxID=3154595 RepID=UPI0033E8029A